jgi:hypothetical protein
MRVIQRSGESSYVSTGIFLYLFIWIFIFAWVAAIVIALLTVGLIVYLAGTAWTLLHGGKQEWHGWNQRWAVFLRHTAGQQDEPEPATEPESETEFIYHDDGVRMV